MASSMSTWLAGLTSEELAEVLACRPDVLRGPEPRTVSELAERLQHNDSVYEALATLNVPCLQAIEALLALGPVPTPAGLAGLLDRAERRDEEHAADVDQVLAELRGRALAWPSADRLHVAAALRAAFPDPLGLGTPARPLLAQRTVADLNAVQKALDLPRGGNKRAVIEAIARRLDDAAFVRAQVDGLPPFARRRLEQRAAPDHDDVDDLDDFAASYDADLVLVACGLLIAAPWGPQTYLPAEVTRALRGEGYRAPFTPRAPSIALVDVGVDAVEREAGVAAADFAERAAAVLDVVAAAPLTCLKSGGVGARELARLARACAPGEDVTRMVVELAAAAGLVDAGREQVLVTAAYDEWREQEPSVRMAPLLAAWWTLASTPTASRDRDGKAIPAFALRMPCEQCRAGRQALAATLGSLPDGQGAADPESVDVATWWSRPSAHFIHGADGLLPWREAEMLGVVARGALTRVGRAVLAGEALDPPLAALLPDATHVASFGSDLTVLVSGAPSARVRALLDGSADRESRGAASVWRFSPASIRRALDAGTTGDELASELAAVAAGPLPQPLRYLIGDVARRHGQLRVSAAVCCIRCDDEALLAEVVAHRKLSKIKLRLLAPTVAASAASVADTLAALRAEGYLPVAEGADREVKLERIRRPRASATRHAPTPKARPPAADPAEVAARLRAAPAQAPRRTGTELLISEWVTDLGIAEIRQLAHAVDHREAVRIEYQAATGGYTSRVVSDLQLDPPFLVGWCHLREAERMFTLSRILSATAV